MPRLTPRETRLRPLPPDAVAALSELEPAGIHSTEMHTARLMLSRGLGAHAAASARRGGR